MRDDLVKYGPQLHSIGYLFGEEAIRKLAAMPEVKDVPGLAEASRLLGGES